MASFFGCSEDGGFERAQRRTGANRNLGGSAPACERAQQWPIPFEVSVMKTCRPASAVVGVNIGG
jgi:hypothetical protein